MANLTLTLPDDIIICNGRQVTFKAPCDCSNVQSVIIKGITYALVDSNKRPVSGGNAFCEDALVTVLLDTENNYAYLLNGGDASNFSDITPEGIGAVNKAGDTMTGTFEIKNATPLIKLTDSTSGAVTRLLTDENVSCLQTINDGNDVSTRRSINLYNSDNSTRGELSKSLALLDTIEGATTIYPIYHTGNKPTAADVGAWPLDNRGTLISQNADLNDYKTPGKYYSYGTAISSTLSNSPDTYYGFELIVDKGFAYAGDLAQIAFVGPDRKICTRSYNSNTDTWQPWAGAVSKAGDTMTGTSLGLNNGLAKLLSASNLFQLSAYKEAGKSSNASHLQIFNAADGALKDLVNLAVYDADGNRKNYHLYGEHNKPTAADVGAPTLESNGRINGLQACSAIKWVTESTTLTTDDIGKTIVCYNSSAATVTISAGLPLGSEFEIVRRGAGAVTIATASTNTKLYAVETVRTIKNQYGVVVAKRIWESSDSWLLTGDLG